MNPAIFLFFRYEGVGSFLYKISQFIQNHGTAHFVRRREKKGGALFMMGQASQNTHMSLPPSVGHSRK